MSNKKLIINNLNGTLFIKSILKEIPNASGIYKMIDSKNKIIYIGKAKNLKSRITSYTLSHVSLRVAYMINNVKHVEWIVTKTELEALLLEGSLIKEIQPQYNILLKDDKTFPFLKIDLGHKFPRISKFRSKNGLSAKGLFGPFASAQDVEENIKVFQNSFLIRTCTDTFFKNRIKPCILYQIKKCSAPCVEKISQDDYADSVNNLVAFLNGEDSSLKESLIKKMQHASFDNNFEQAIVFRDRIRSLNTLFAKQNVIVTHEKNIDYMVCQNIKNTFYITVFMFKLGRNYGNINFNISPQLEYTLQDILSQFIMQFYEERSLPHNIVSNVQFSPEQTSLLRAAFKTKKKVSTIITTAKTKMDKRIIELVKDNNTVYLERNQANNTKWLNNFQDLQKLFHIKENISKIEIFDNSHLYGTLALGVMVCAEVSGFNKKGYRAFHVKSDINMDDDYAILNEVLRRRFLKLKNNSPDKPDLVLIDGGKGQLGIALKVVKEMGLNINLVGVAKGKDRYAGNETLYLTNEEINLEKHSPILHFVQRLRNEAHRFAINSVRRRKLKTIIKSTLDDIPGVGKERKKLLLDHFGSVTEIKNATIQELSKVKSIDKSLATKIFNWLHS